MPQVYVGRPDSAPVPMAVKSLAGFERVELAPGEARKVTLQIPQRQFSHWSIDKRGWQFVGGERPLYVRSSSRDIRLTGKASAK